MPTARVLRGFRAAHPLRGHSAHYRDYATPWRQADNAHKIGLRTIRPYAMNAIRRPITPLKIMGVISWYLACTPMNTRLSIAKTVAAATVSAGCQWKAAGTISPTVQTSSRMPRAIHASRGNAPKDGTSLLTLSNMKTFMTPDAP